MKSMNCGTPASVALPERSSFGMMRSTSSLTVAYSWAVKNFGLNGAAVVDLLRRRLRLMVRLLGFGFRPGQPRGRGSDRQRLKDLSSIGFHVRSSFHGVKVFEERSNLKDGATR